MTTCRSMCCTMYIITLLLGATSHESHEYEKWTLDYRDRHTAERQADGQRKRQLDRIAGGVTIAIGLFPLKIQIARAQKHRFEAEYCNNKLKNSNGLSHYPEKTLHFGGVRAIRGPSSADPTNNSRPCPAALPVC